jgi:hypothetical protein
MGSNHGAVLVFLTQSLGPRLSAQKASTLALDHKDPSNVGTLQCQNQLSKM